MIKFLFPSLNKFPLCGIVNIVQPDYFYAMIKLLFPSLLLLLLAGCSKVGVQSNQLASQKEITSFLILSGKDTIKMEIADGSIEGVTMDTGKKDSMVALFTFQGKKVNINGVEQVSGKSGNNFADSLNYLVEADDGSTKSYKVKLRSFTGLPIFYFTSPPIVSKDIYVDGKLAIDGNMDYPSTAYTIQIRGRGNTTWAPEKKPYKVKLASKSSLLGIAEDKEWAFLANYFDKSLIRNDVAFELSERLQREWTPKRKFVEVFMNGSTDGNYLMTETIKSGNARVNIDVNNGGYLLEANYKEEESEPRFYINTLGNDIPFDIKEGKLSASKIKAQMDTLIYKLDNLMFDPVTGYQANFDLDAFVSWYLVNEIMLNHDAVFFSSVFLQKQNASSKLKMGPVWDFDLSSGNVNHGQTDPEGWYLKSSVIIQNLWMDTLFHQAVRNKWKQYRNQIVSLPDYVGQKGTRLNQSASNNFIRWNILHEPLETTVSLFGTYAEEVNYLKSFLGKRIAWMDREINK